MICQYSGCLKSAVYGLEWFGEDDSDGEIYDDIDLAAEIFVCFNPRHIVELSKIYKPGRFPDEIYYIDDHTSKEKLLESVKRAMGGYLDEDSIDDLVKNIDPDPRQLTIF